MYSLALGSLSFGNKHLVSAINLHQCSAVDLNPYNIVSIGLFYAHGL